MARAVYSTRFIGASGTPLAFTDYIVPDGFVAVVRDVTVLQASGGSGIASVVVLDPEFWLFYLPTPATTSTLTTATMRVVLNAGETLEARSTSTALVSVAASGYLLSV